jgi:hypothetical protein
MAELVKKTSAAVAVTDELTTLIDWVNIEQVSGFTIIVKNAGGGSGNDITDVQIDTSSDGGVTVETDQHAGIPSVPIASGATGVGTFTDTANFLRVRALCATDEDTTAEAWLLADSSVGRICTIDDIKNRLGITSTDHDQTIGRIVLGLEAIFDRYCRRKIIQTGEDVTEYYAGMGRHLQILYYPIISITTIKESYSYDFDSATALTVDTSYRLVGTGKSGILYRIGSSWPDQEDAIQIVYRGGYCSAADTPGDSETALPADLREAAIEQGSFVFKRRDDIGLSSVGFTGGSINKFSAMKLLPMVEAVLKSHIKPSL